METWETDLTTFIDSYNEGKKAESAAADKLAQDSTDFVQQTMAPVFNELAEYFRKRGDEVSIKEAKHQNGRKTLGLEMDIKTKTGHALISQGFTVSNGKLSQSVNHMMIHGNEKSIYSCSKDELRQAFVDVFKRTLKPK